MYLSRRTIVVAVPLPAGAAAVPGAGRLRGGVDG
ncbi:hypothetical protein J2S43_005875 [Catenuloplanes nepalensis]|uniref:Uncharacterized protein n=1 Tax=Catenuloplanes nepalensis TaxID=587533 RepID=A0ABT9N0Y5_9ACTN|nr:hypothetical protein [Catenuloplanes nepalensis]